LLTGAAAFEGLKLGDRRRERRWRQIAAALEENPELSLPKAVGSDSAAEAAYRLLGSRAFRASTIVDHLSDVAWRNAAGAKVVLAIHDTTQFSFTGSSRDGLSEFSSQRQGFYAHTALLVAAEGVPRAYGAVGCDPYTVGSKKWYRPAGDDEEIELILGPERASEVPESMVSVTGDAVAAVAPPRNDVPRGGIVAIVGGNTAVGKSLLRARFAADAGWSLRVLLNKGESIGEMARLGVEGAPAASGAELRKALEGASALIIVSAAAGGKGGVETEQVKALVAAIPDGMRRVVFLSSHGVERADKLPFSLVNAWGGPLDKVRAAEQEVILRAKGRLPSFSVVRVGKLVDADGAPRRAEIASGDALQGDVTIGSASSVLLQSLSRQEAVNASFSVAPLARDLVGAAAPDESHWADEFLKLVGPELYRRALGGDAAAIDGDELRGWLREFALRFVQPGAGLTTPVELDDLEGGRGVILRFVQKNPNVRYANFDQRETDDEKWAKAKASSKQSKATPDGALYLHAETEPYARVRVTRAEMDKDGIDIKPMSEATILEALDKAIATLEKKR
jgi:hypothetical protein